jgi:polyisoprenoid-binding protein YceI
MKKILFVLLVFLSTTTILAQEKKINVKKSNITWKGKKVTGEHLGTINFKDGALFLKDGKIYGGNFTANMTSLSNTDQSGKDKEKLEAHLKSEDFFNIKDYSTSKMVFKSVIEKKKNLYTVKADLTIKGKTNPVTFDLAVADNSATADLKIDRTKYGIQYGSGSFFDDLGDRTIYDDFELKVVIHF